MTSATRPERSVRRTALTLLLGFFAYLCAQVAASLLLTRDVFVAGLVSLSLLVAGALWGALVLRRAVRSRWLPAIGVASFVLLLFGLFVTTVAAECLIRPRCFG
jgi:hypothetical protein